eukprot:148124-Pelagomonas_calceolata.AAC.2
MSEVTPNQQLTFQKKRKENAVQTWQRALRQGHQSRKAGPHHTDQEEAQAQKSTPASGRSQPGSKSMQAVCTLPALLAEKETPFGPRPQSETEAQMCKVPSMSASRMPKADGGLACNNMHHPGEKLPALAAA